MYVCMYGAGPRPHFCLRLYRLIGLIKICVVTQKLTEEGHVLGVSHALQAYGTWPNHSQILVDPSFDLFGILTHLRKRRDLRSNISRNLSGAARHPSVWNSLPDNLRDPAVGNDSFRRSLKTFLFATYWDMQRIRGSTRMRYTNLLLLTYSTRNFWDFEYVHTVWQSKQI